MALVFCLAGCSGQAEEPSAVLPSPGPETDVEASDPPGPLMAATTVLLDGGPISFSVVWEDPSLGVDASGSVRSEGTFDPQTLTAVYSPFLAQSEEVEVRIAGSDLYVYDGQGSWTHSVSDDPSWLELMPLSGSPLLILQRIQEVTESVPESAPDGAIGSCYRVTQDPTAELAASFTACIDDSVLRWVRFDATEASGELTATFEHTDRVNVIVPTEGVTEFPGSS